MRGDPRELRGEPSNDPFGERKRAAYRWSSDCLGARVHFSTDDAALMSIVRSAYADLPAQLLSPCENLHVHLISVPSAGSQRDQPPPILPCAAGPLLAGAVGGSSFITVDPQGRHALVAVAQPLLRFARQVRYELIEFATYLLAARAQTLVPLHAACFGVGRRGLLLMGESGAGKSTLMLHAVQHGCDFLAEDSVLVRPRDLLATGLASFLHLRADVTRFLPAGDLRRRILRAPTIQRRSGVRKFEIDLRRLGAPLARHPLQLCAVVFLSAAPGAAPGALRALRGAELRHRLCTEQPYAMGQRGWKSFMAQAQRLPAFELSRARHPRAAAESLAALLSATPGRMPR